MVILIAKLVVLVLHITSAAIIFGVTLGAAGGLRAGLAAGDRAFVAVAAGAARRGSLAKIGALITLVTGVLLIFMGGGFGAVTPNFHIALTLMLAAIGLSTFFTAPNMKRLVQLSHVSPLDQATAEPLIGRVGLGVSLSHALWVVILVLMLYRF